MESYTEMPNAPYSNRLLALKKKSYKLNIGDWKKHGIELLSIFIAVVS